MLKSLVVCLKRPSFFDGLFCILVLNMHYMRYLLTFILFGILFSCQNKEKVKIQKEEKPTVQEKYQHKKNKEFNEYWYDGFAEITSYKLEQVRYGEIHEGTAVTIFVTEDFLPDKQVKADYKNDTNIPILKLNRTKKFTTGLYPYSLMTSVFSPLKKENHALKISHSTQEWCGNTFVQLNNRTKYEVDFKSYFESNSDKNFTLDKVLLEDELWTLLRMSPENLPTENQKIIPSLAYLSLFHKEIKSYDAHCSLVKTDTNSVFTINYPELNRKLIITYYNSSPFQIEQWEEIILQGGKEMSTRAVKMKSMKSKYWNKNSNNDKELRLSLNL